MSKRMIPSASSNIIGVISEQIALNSLQLNCTREQAGRVHRANLHLIVTNQTKL